MTIRSTTKKVRTSRNFLRDGKMFGLITGNFERDVTNKKLSHDDLFIMREYLEEVMWEELYRDKIEQNWE